VRRLLIGGSPDQERCPASEVNDGGCPEKPVHLNAMSKAEVLALRVIADQLENGEAEPVSIQFSLPLSA
jgi:hypothetical protein